MSRDQQLWSSDGQTSLHYDDGPPKRIGRVFGDCGAQPDCAKAHPQLEQSFTTLLDSFGGDPRIAVAVASGNVEAFTRSLQAAWGALC